MGASSNYNMLSLTEDVNLWDTLVASWTTLAAAKAAPKQGYHF